MTKRSPLIGVAALGCLCAAVSSASAEWAVSRFVWKREMAHSSGWRS
jgi:hypothetical protein